MYEQRTLKRIQDHCHHKGRTHDSQGPNPEAGGSGGDQRSGGDRGILELSGLYFMYVGIAWVSGSLTSSGRLDHL